MVYTSDPDDAKAPQTLAFVVRRANRADKVKFVLRSQSKLSPGEELDKKVLRDFFKSNDIFLAIEDDEVTLIHQENIVRKATEEQQSVLEHQSELPGA